MQEVKVKHSGEIILLGKQGENLARRVQFDISRWISSFGPGTVQLLHQRPGEDTVYPVAIIQEDNWAVWEITATETALPGVGHCELRYYVDETLAKSETWMTKITKAMEGDLVSPPAPGQSWADQVLQAGAAAVEAAEKAESAVVRQPYPNAETGTWWVWDAESGAYTDTGVSYGTGGGGGTSDHDKLLGRNKADQHPISAITGLEDALAGKQPTGSYLTKETDPTVPDWAKAETKPSYTAPEVGADPSGTAAAIVSEHNTEATAHSDMRLLLQGLTDRLNALADSDDTTLDQLSEIVAYIKSNRDLIAAVTTDKVSVADIVDNLTTNVANTPLSAAQGVALKAMIDAINAVSIGAIPAPATAAVGQTIRVSAVDENGQPTEWEAVDFAIGGGGGGSTVTPELLYSGTAETVTEFNQKFDTKGHNNFCVVVGGTKGESAISISKGYFYINGKEYNIFYYTAWLVATNTSYPNGSVWEVLQQISPERAIVTYAQNNVAINPVSGYFQGNGSLNATAKSNMIYPFSTSKADGLELKFSASVALVEVSVYGF